MQQFIVIFLVAACAAWGCYWLYKFFAPKKGRSCGGGCCDGGKTESKDSTPKPTTQTLFIPSDDLVARIKARKS